jgi:hypothetical protein
MKRDLLIFGQNIAYNSLKKKPSRKYLVLRWMKDETNLGYKIDELNTLYRPPTCSAVKIVESLRLRWAENLDREGRHGAHTKF